MSHEKTCVKCNIKRDSREYKFEELSNSNQYMCHVCHKDAIFIPCMICDNEFDRTVGTNQDWSSKHAIETYPDLCESCYMTSDKLGLSHKSLELINNMYKKIRDNSEHPSIIETHQLKELANAVNARIDLKINKTYKAINDKIKNNTKSIKSINEKVNQVGNKLDEYIDPDIYALIDKNVSILEERISDYKCDIDDTCLGINQSIEFVKKYDTLSQSYDNNKLRHNQLTLLKDTTDVNDLVHLYKSLHELECKIDFVDINTQKYLDHKDIMESENDHIENFKSEIKKCQMKISKLKYFSSDDFCEKNIIEF
jgi:hypothetical protein